MKRFFYPTISILIPTLNAASVLDKCLASIKNQNYPKDKIEIIIADGGSQDKTLEIAQKNGAKIYSNPLKTGEAGKAVALKYAKGELVALIDSDNILPEKNWFKRIIAPFANPQVIGSEPFKFTYRRQDGFIDRYCALMGLGDPTCLFLGNYAHQSVLSGRWTNLPIKQEDKGQWFELTLGKDIIPLIGANGTILRKKIFSIKGLVGDYLFDIDIITQLASHKPIKFAKVKIGIIHLFCGSNIKKYIRKQKRRVQDYLYYQRIGLRKYPWKKFSKKGLLKFIFSTITIIPLFYQTLKGYLKVADPAWFFHPLACWFTLWVYSFETILEFLTGSRQMDRSQYGQ